MTKEEFLAHWNLLEADYMIMEENGKFIADICPSCNEIMETEKMMRFQDLQPEYCRCEDGD